MRKALLAFTTLALMASMAPAHAVSSIYTRTIIAPTTFGDDSGVISLPSIIDDPTTPSSWDKIGTSSVAARCAYVKQTEGILPAGTAQDATTGKLGYVVALPTAFVAGDTFSLVADTANAQFDFDVIFFTSLGKCANDRQVSLPAGAGCLTVPLEGPGPNPAPRESASAPSGSCGLGGPKSMYTRIGNDSGTVSFNANFALVLMPVGANGKFKLTVNY